MTDFSTLLQQGSTNAWLFIPSAIILGAAHGLEPGHSKTMMASFIIAVRGTLGQAVLLGLSAAISHSLVIWGLAAAGLYFGQALNAESVEPYFQVASGVIIIATAVWMALRTWKDIQASKAHASSHSHGHSSHEGPDHEHGPHTDHAHHTSPSDLDKGPHGGFLVDTGHGLVELSVFEQGIPPRFELRFLDHKGLETPPWSNTTVTVETRRLDGELQTFAFKQEGTLLISTTEIPEPHEFTAQIRLDHGGHAHLYPIQFTEQDHHHAELKGGSEKEYEDEHERYHAREIETRFANQKATTGQIIVFGLTGGLMPCPASLTVLLLCLQLKKFVLGFTLVLCFSLGLALTLVLTGVLAAWSLHHATKRFKGFSEIGRKIPLLSSTLLIVMGLYLIFSGIRHLAA